MHTQYAYNETKSNDTDIIPMHCLRSKYRLPEPRSAYMAVDAVDAVDAGGEVMLQSSKWVLCLI